MTDTVDVTASESGVSVTVSESGLSVTASESGVSVSSQTLSESPLIVPSGETVTVPAGETWTRTYSEVRDGGTLNTDGTLKRTA